MSSQFLREINKNVIRSHTKHAYYIFHNYTQLLEFYPNRKLHNKTRVKNDEIYSEETFEGREVSMACSYLLHFVYNRYLFYPKLMYTEFTQDNVLQSHTFLQYKDYIIDPTWRHNWVNDTYTEDDEYLQELFVHNPYVFIGTLEDKKEIYRKLNGIHLNLYEEELENKMHIWENAEDITDCLVHDKGLKNYLLRETLIVKDYNTLIDNLLKLKENKL
jgi:hypothetical protein